MKLRIRGLPGPGYDSVGVAGRRWPAAGLAVHLVDGDADPKPEKGADGVQGPLVIGQQTFAVLNAHPRLVIAPAEGIQDVAKIKAELARALARVAELEAKAEADDHPEKATRARK